MRLTGGCQCGAVRYESITEPAFQGNCHCRDCQHSTGSAYSPALFVNEADVRITGAVTWYTSQGGSGREIARGFCPVCGSRLFTRPVVLGGLLGILAGSLDEPALFQPQIDIYTSHAHAWDTMNPALAKCAESPRKG